MSERGFLTDTQKSLLESEYEGSDEARRATEYRIRQRTEHALKDLIQVAESNQIDIDDEIWYQHIPRLIHAVMAPPEDFEPINRYDGTTLEHRKEYPLQYALLDRLIRSVNAFEEAFHSHGVPGGIVTDLPEGIEEPDRENQ